MKIIIIGGVAAGTSAAAKARRNNEQAGITIFDADQDVSYSGCGLPYYIGAEIKSRSQLVPRNAQLRELITESELLAKLASGENVQVIDARVAKQYQEGHVAGAKNIPQEQIRSELDSLDQEALTVTYCNKGTTGNATQNILLNHGFRKVFNLSGGYKNYSQNNKR